MRVVVITGGTSGIGLSCAQFFASKGDTVVVLARKNPNNMENFYACDVTDDARVDEVFEQIYKKFKQIDVLINNAGYGLSGAVELTDTKDIRQIFDVNLFGAINCYKSALKYMKSGAKIINMSSVCALFPLQFRGLYCSSKAALSMFSYSMALECKPFGVKVLTVCPGDVKTNFTASRVKNFATNQRYGTRIKDCTDGIDKNENKRMPAIKVAKATYKYSLKHKPKPFIIVGGKYKALYFASKILPTRWIHGAIFKFFE